MVFKPVDTGNCAQCGQPIPVFIIVDGHKRYHRGRKQCFVCWPFKPKKHPWVNQHGGTHRECHSPHHVGPLLLPISDFQMANMKKGYKNSYCRTCQTIRIRDSRQRFKDQCIAYKGGKCEACGYDRCRDAMDFHHLGDKEFQLSRYQRCSLNDLVKQELDKCHLLCANCHREAHALTESFRNGATRRRCIDPHAENQDDPHAPGGR
jgi:hypothetical protein